MDGCHIVYMHSLYFLCPCSLIDIIGMLYARTPDKGETILHAFASLSETPAASMMRTFRPSKDDILLRLLHVPDNNGNLPLHIACSKDSRQRPAYRPFMVFPRHSSRMHTYLFLW
jgi:hypothetical protein